jgi:glyoxylase-like metal-dependent hydrolase (beta-lactamase superfamily II)
MDYEQIYQGNMVEVFRISDYFYFRRGNLPVRNQCNGAFIVSDTGVIVLDAPPGGIEMVEEVEKLFHKPLIGLCITHEHLDHTEGLAPFLELDISVYCNYRILSYLAPDTKKYNANIIGIDGELKLRLAGGIDVELFTLKDITHSRGDMFVRIPKLGIICAGDCVVEFQTAYFHGADTRSWIYALRKLADQKGSYILAGHGPSLFPYSYITEFADYLSVIEKCANLCFPRFHPELLGKTGEERFANVTTDEVKALIEDFFSERSGDVLFLEEKAGKTDARRTVRMVLWELIRAWIR